MYFEISIVFKKPGVNIYLIYIFQLKIIIHLFIPTNFKSIKKKKDTIIEGKNALVNK